MDCDDNLACTIITCDPNLPGLCAHVPAVCNNANICNRVFSCNTTSGGCVDDSVAVDCNNGDACLLGTCNVLMGDCSSPPCVCDDGNVFTLNHTCNPVTGFVFQAPEVSCYSNEVCEFTAGKTSIVCGGMPLRYASVSSGMDRTFSFAGL